MFQFPSLSDSLRKEGQSSIRMQLSVKYQRVKLFQSKSLISCRHHLQRNILCPVQEPAKGGRWRISSCYSSTRSVASIFALMKKNFKVKSMNKLEQAQKIRNLHLEITNRKSQLNFCIQIGQELRLIFILPNLIFCIKWK